MTGAAAGALSGATLPFRSAAGVAAESVFSGDSCFTVSFLDLDGSGSDLASVSRVDGALSAFSSTALAAGTGTGSASDLMWGTASGSVEGFKGSLAACATLFMKSTAMFAGAF